MGRVPGTLRTQTRPLVATLAKATTAELAARGVPVAGSCTIASWLGQLVLRKAGIEATPISVECSVEVDGHFLRTATDEFNGLPGVAVPAYLNVELGDPEVWPKAYGLPGGAIVNYSHPAALSPEEAADGEDLVEVLDEWADRATRRARR